MKKLAVLTLLMGLVTVATPSSAYALSCAELDPVDWASRFPSLDGAYVGWVTAIAVEPETVTVTVAVADVLVGPHQRELAYTVPNHDPWGPFYEVGRRIAVVVEGGTTSDGVQELCGPWYRPDELRDAARRHGSWHPSVFDRLADSLWGILRAAA